MQPKSARFNGSGYLVASSAAWGVIPLIIATGGGGDSPFSFTASWSFGSVIGSSVFLLTFTRQMRPRDWWAAMVCPPGGFWKPLSDQNGGWNWQMVAAVIRMAVILMVSAWVANYLSEVIIAVVLESWPVFFLLILHLLFREKQTFKVDWVTIALFLLVFTGVVLAIFSQGQDSALEPVSVVDFLVALLLLTTSVLLAAGDGIAVKWVTIVAGTFGGQGSGEETKSMDMRSLEVGATQFTRLLAFVFGVFFGLVPQLFVHESYTLEDFLTVSLAGAFVGVMGAATNIIGTFRCHDNPGLLCLRYLTPVFGIGYLWLFTDREEAIHWGLMGSGLAIILAGSVIISLRR